MSFTKACSGRMFWRLKAKNAGLMAGFFLLLFFSTCRRDQDDFYLSGVDEQFNVERIDTATVLLATERMSKVYTNNLTANRNESSDLVGTFNDPFFGRTTGIVYSNIERANIPPAFTASSKVDSFILFVRLHNYGSIGAVNEKHKWRFYELKSKLDNSLNYYSDTTLPHSSESVSFEGYLDAADSLLKVNMVSGDFPTFPSKFLTADPKVYSDNVLFAEFFNGFAIVPDTTDPFSKTGAIVSLDLNDAASRLVLYYDTSKSYSMRFGNTRVNTYKHNYTGSIAGQSLNKKGSPNVYLQSMAGMRINVQLPYLKEFARQQKLALHSARLVFTDIDSSSDLFRYGRPDRVLIVDRVESGGNNNLLGFSDFSSIFRGQYDGYYNAAEKTYTLGITRYVQDLLSEYRTNPDKQAYGLNVYIPAAEPLAPSRTIIANHGTLRPRLVLTFTKLQE